MSISLNPNAGTVPAGNVDGIPGVTGSQKTVGGADVAGAAQGASSSGAARPALARPVLSPAAMMIALAALNAKIAKEGIAFGETVMEGVHKDIKDAGDKRAEKIKKHFDDMSKISDKQKCGLFGTIALFCKNLCKGDVEGAFNVIWDNAWNIARDVLTIAAAVALVAAAFTISAVTAGAGSGLIVAAGVAAGLMIMGMVVADPELQALVLDLVPEGKPKLYAAIGLTVTAAVISVAGGIVGIVATAGLGSAAVAANGAHLISASAGISAAIAGGKDAVDSYIQASYRADAIKSGAEVDVAEADMTQIKSILDRQQKDLKVLFDAFATIMQSTRDFIMAQGRNEARAASV